MQLCCCSFKRIQLFALLVAVGTIITILMILFFFSYPSIALNRIIDAVIFRNGTDSMDRFRSTKDLKNLRLSFYVYNVTNAEQVVNQSAKINLQEIGPFVYSEYKEKEFIDNNQTSGLVTFRLRRRYILDKTLSIGDPAKTLITWPNVPLIVARSYLDKLPSIERAIAYWAFNAAVDKEKEQAFITDTVQNYIFDGSERQLFKYLQSLDKFKMFNPWPLEDNKFALLYKRNNTLNSKLDLEMTVSTGFGLNQNYTNLNQYVKINGSTRMTYWKNQPPTCNSVSGTDGEFFSPLLKEGDKIRQNLEVYSMDICRKLSLKFRQPTLMNNIPVLKYTLEETTLQSGRNYPNNWCYCLASDPLSSPECQIDGLIDLSTCSNPNVYASGAHFIYSPQKLLDRVSGISQPNSSLHEPVIFIEPYTGLSAKVRVPIQFNVRLEKGGFKIFNFFKDQEPLILPLLWVVESAELTEDQASLLRSKLLLLDSWLVTMVLGGAIVFILAILVATVIICLKFRDSRVSVARAATERDPLINPNEEEASATEPQASSQPASVYQTI